MARIDRIKEEIGWLKIVFGVLVAVDVPLVGWLAREGAREGRGLVIAAAIVAVLFTAGVVAINGQVYVRLREFENQ